MAKKTKKTAKKRSIDRRAARASARAERYQDLIDLLDEWVDRGGEFLLDSIPFRRDLCEREYQRRLKLYGPDDAPTLAEFASGGFKLDELFRLEEGLKLAANRLALLDGYRHQHRAPLDEFLRRYFERPIFPPSKAWSYRRDIEVFRAVIAALRKLVEADGMARAVAKSNRKPSQLEKAILDVLLDADGSLSGKEIASKVERKLHQPKTVKSIYDAIGKLRADCGFPGLLAGDAGFKLTPDERALAAKIRARSE